MAEQTTDNELPIGTTLLRSQYRIERTLLEGGFGITYLARDSLDRQVVIKECFLEMLCDRSGQTVVTRSDAQEQKFQGVINNFLKEARRLAKLKHPNIVGVHQVFEENGTAYMSMDFVDGFDFLTLLEDSPKKLTSKLLQRSLREILGALKYIHGLQILHRDISPDNIMLDAEGHLKLIDFGAARDNCLRKDRAMTALLSVKDGYSPHEFYLDDTEQKTSSDLYSLGATFYHLVTGESPPDSQKRIAALASDRPDPYQPLATQALAFDPTFLKTIDKCMSISQQERIQTAAEWLQLLKASECQVSASANSPKPSEDALVGSIAELVAATNNVVKRPGFHTDRERRRTEELKARTQPAADKQLVDIFGNPIHDVDAWLQEQEDLLMENETEVDVRVENVQGSRPFSALFLNLFRTGNVEATSPSV